MIIPHMIIMAHMMIIPHMIMPHMMIVPHMIMTDQATAQARDLPRVQAESWIQQQQQEEEEEDEDYDGVNEEDFHGGDEAGGLEEIN